MQPCPEIEKHTLAEQREFQWEEIKNTLVYLEKYSPFYQRLFKEHHILSRNIRSFDDFEKLPVTEKNDLQKFNDDFLCVTHDKIAEIVSTSGTLGKPVNIALTHSDLERLAYNEYLSFQLMELNNLDKVQLLLTLDKQFMAGIAYYSGLRKLGATVIRSGPGQSEKQWELISNLGTTTLVAVPSFLLKMLDKRPVTIPQSLKKVLAIGEPLKEENGNPTTLAQKIKEQLDVQLYGTYAATELQTAFTECTFSCGGHHHPELIYIELLDDENNPAAPGEAGELTITTFKVKGMPLLRYKTGDIFKISEAPCSCGRKSVRLSGLLGRKKQMIKYKGTTFYPPALENLLYQVPNISEYGLRIEKDNWGNDRLSLFVATEASEEEVLHQIEAICRQRLRVVPEIIFSSISEMKAFLFPDNNRKPLRIQDVR